MFMCCGGWYYKYHALPVPDTIGDKCIRNSSDAIFLIPLPTPNPRILWGLIVVMVCNHPDPGYNWGQVYKNKAVTLYS